MPDITRVLLRELEARESYACTFCIAPEQHAIYEFTKPRLRPPLPGPRIFYLCQDHMLNMLQQAHDIEVENLKRRG